MPSRFLLILGIPIPALYSNDLIGKPDGFWKAKLLTKWASIDERFWDGASHLDDSDHRRIRSGEGEKNR
jgi:hypothetical protein